ncbi:MAG: SLC13 family permease [Defluviitaleaceae bacterium]|nr:SLC13 family permease [Defluviitaleaceae bacterium]
MQPSTIALIIIGALLILYISELFPIAVTSVLACLAMSIFGVIPFRSAFAGFGNDIVFLMAGMMIIGNALFETGVAQIVGKWIISKVGKSERLFLGALIFVSIPISAFLSNTATAAIMLPLAASAINASGGKFTKKNTFMIIGIASVAGGGLTLVSSTPQLIAQGILEEGGHELMGFFDIALAGVPILILLIIYALTIGYQLQKKIFNFDDVSHNSAVAANKVTTVVSDKNNESIKIVKITKIAKIVRIARTAKNTKTAKTATRTETGAIIDSEKIHTKKEISRMCISVGALAFCVIGFITEIWSVGIVSMLGASVCIVTGCISQKRVFEKMDWSTLIIFGCSFGFAAGLDQSGAGQLIAQTAISILGNGISPWMLCIVLALIAVVLGNFMSATATAALLIPIAVFSAVELGYDVRSVVLATAIAANISYATPISTPPMTMTLPAGYRFMDYIKIGGLFNIMALILLILLFPLILNI